MIRKEELFQLGVFAKPHGIKGEITLLTDHDVFEGIHDLFVVCEMDGICVPFFIQSFRLKGSASILVKLEHMNDANAVRRFVGKEVYFPLKYLKEQQPNEGSPRFYVGYGLVDEEEGEIGTIEEVDDSTLNVLFKTTYQGKELYVPAANELIQTIDHVNKRLTLRLPQGILSL